MAQQESSTVDITRFFGEVTDALRDLYEALATGQNERISETAQILKASSVAFGAMAFASLLEELQAIAASGDFLKTAEHINLVEEEFPKVKAALEAHYSQDNEEADRGYSRERSLILVVDGDDDSRRLLRDELIARGYKALDAPTGVKAVNVLSQFRPSLILLDGSSPSSDAVAVCQHLQSIPAVSQIPILVIMEPTDQEAVERVLEAGAVDYVSKPIHWPVLYKRMQRLLAARQADDVLRRTQDELERRVRQRTAELTAANKRLLQEGAWREQVKEQLLQSEAHLRRITDNMLDIIWQTNEAGIIEYASPSCWSILGYAPEALVDRSIFTWVHPDDLEQTKEDVYNVGRAEFRFQCAGGAYAWLETLTNWLFEGGQSPVGLVWASRNITERKLAEQELLELNRMKTEFLSTAAHELRTPLVSIRGFAEILLTRQFEPDRQRRYLSLINEQSVQLGHILDDLLDISRLEAKQNMTLEFIPISVTELVSSILPLYEVMPNHRIQLEGLDQCPPIRGDANRLAQVLKNLLSNAIKYSPDGGTITLHANACGDYVQIAVEDEGVGLTPEQITHLFEKFYRANASNTAVGGTGLGLSICKLIVELHGGKLWAESTYGKGSTFFFTIAIANQAGASE
ncbi:MAG TPA: ATP-binding protein [Aggregatilineales bacterium]|nr:ATP-binding protein [Aggregatilineales bacterium]